MDALIRKVWWFFGLLLLGIFLQGVSNLLLQIRVYELEKFTYNFSTAQVQLNEKTLDNFDTVEQIIHQNQFNLMQGYGKDNLSR